MLRLLHEHEDSALMERIWRFRHTRFVEQLGWSELRQPDGRERDKFDDEKAIHIVLLHDDLILGYSRLLPTTGPHLAIEIYRDVSLEPPKGPGVVEWTRCATTCSAARIGTARKAPATPHSPQKKINPSRSAAGLRLRPRP